MKAIILLLILGLVVAKEAISLEADKKKRGDQTNKKIIDFLSSKKQQMETFLTEMVNQSSINDKEKRLLQEIKDYVVLLGQQREVIKKSNDQEKLDYVDNEMKSLIGKIDKIDQKNNLCACRGEKDCDCDFTNQLPAVVNVEKMRFGGKKVKENG